MDKHPLLQLRDRSKVHSKDIFLDSLVSLRVDAAGKSPSMYSSNIVDTKSVNIAF